MKIYLEHISKRFQRHWIFKDINLSFKLPGAYAILGANGSGKSTLLRVIAGMQSASGGTVRYENDTTKLAPDEVFRYISFCAPSQEIPDEMTLYEFFQFHYSFKVPYPGLSIDSVIAITGLGHAQHKSIANYSSGMKQRVKLAQAIFTNSPVLLLDEPCTNLDDVGVQQYHDWITHYTQGKLVIVASNDAREYDFCRERYSMADYK